VSNLALVDSCVLLDVFNDDPNWFEWSSNTLYEISRDYELAINIIIFTEVSLNFSSVGQLENTLTQLAIGLQDIPAEAGFRVGRIFRKYRKNRGERKVPMPGFYIGAHASVLNVPLVTRDVSRFKTYFPEVKLISP